MVWATGRLSSVTPSLDSTTAPPSISKTGMCIVFSFPVSYLPNPFISRYRFRTYFPDAYKQHYPNAKTHLSSKVRSTLPDGSSLFEKTRSKKRRPFTEDEDRALKAGYEKHGTVWATIVKDPVFQEQGRRSTDLRDRFRNAFPELYQAAGYKPRNVPKKKAVSDGPRHSLPRAATDDQLAMTTGPVRRRRRNTSQGLLRGGTKSVPQSTAPSEDEYSSGGEDDNNHRVKPPSEPPGFLSSLTASRPKRSSSLLSPAHLFGDDDEMEHVTLDSICNPDFLANSSPSDMDAHSQTWSSGLDTPTHSSHHAWSAATNSPTSSHLSADYLMNSSHSSPFERRSESANGFGMIGKSAWGTQDWFSANPRLDPESSGSNTSSAFDGGFSPASPFSFSQLNHGVFDRYDLVPASMPTDFSSEVGLGDSHSTFSDELFPPSSGFRGFTHHSNYAGDLIFGARTHQPQQSFYGYGLGLSGMSQSAGIHPMQLHTPALPGIDEIELAGINLNDQVDTQPDAMEEASLDIDITDGQKAKPQRHDSDQRLSSLSGADTPFDLDDLVDFDLPNEMHLTPPCTPIMQSRPFRNSSRSVGGYNSTHIGMHGRSVSVPPMEARNALPGDGQTSRPPQVHANSQPELISSREVTLFRGTESQNRAPQVTTAMSPPPPPSSFPSHLLTPVTSSSPLPQDPYRQSNNDLYGLPFLDLHYYGHGSTSSGSGGYNGSDSLGLLSDIYDVAAAAESQSYRQGQALDLARSAVSSSGKATAVPMSSSTTGPVPLNTRRASSGGSSWGGAMTRRNVAGDSGDGGFMMGGSKVSVASQTTRAPMKHHRGQSAVCPQDLLLRSDTNKRKRASWDGAHT